MSAEAKFTPGPWETYLVDRDVVVIRKMTHDGEQELQQIARCTSGFDNAQLIAAAPELYEALEAMLEDGVFAGCDWIPSDNAKQRADAALAKARGES